MRIVLRADSGFAGEALMAWCADNRVDDVLRLARNARLVAEIEAELALVEETSRRTGASARRFKDVKWITLTSWSHRRRVVAEGRMKPSVARVETGPAFHQPRPGPAPPGAPRCRTSGLPVRI